MYLTGALLNKIVNYRPIKYIQMSCKWKTINITLKHLVRYQGLRSFVVLLIVSDVPIIFVNRHLALLYCYFY